MTGPGAAERAQAVASFDPGELQGLVTRSSDAAWALGDRLGVGVSASPGRGAGQAYFDIDSALAALERGESVVLVASSTSPSDEPALRHAAAVVTSGGGLASHAAIVARGWGIPAVCGVEKLRVEPGEARFGDVIVRPGDQIVVDGSTGVIGRGSLHHLGGAGPSPDLDLPGEVSELLGWADEITAGRVAVLANADTAADVVVAMRFGAGGVGLCRTEHWFLGEHRPLLAELLGECLPPERAGLLDRFEQVNRTAAGALLDAADGAPVTLRLLDASPDEFGVGSGLDHPRGVRAGRLRNDLYRAQLRAFVDAGATRQPPGAPARLQLLVPMVSGPDDLEFVLGLLDEVRGATGVPLPVGAMIEVPGAALTAAAIARRSAFLAIGTNDLTAAVWGLDRTTGPPSTGGADPFRSLDVPGVGRLIGLAIADASAATPGLDVSVCGEVAGDPASIGPLIELGVTALSVSPFRVPGARLAAAQALLRLDAGGVAAPLGAG